MSVCPEPKLFKEVAAKPCFYSDPAIGGAQTLDGAVGQLENRLARLLNDLRISRNESVDPLLAAELVTHLAVRPAYVPNTAQEAIEQLVAGLLEKLGQQQILTALIGLDGRPTPFLDTILNSILARPEVIGSGIVEPLWRQTAATWLREHPDELLSALRNFLLLIPPVVPRAVREGLRAALSAALAPPKRVEDLTAFNWYVVLANNNDSFILPDCVALAYESGLDPLPLFMARASRTRAVLMPIAAGRMLVGRRAGGSMPLAELEDFNNTAAACSHEFFVSAVASPELSQAATLIGSRTSHIIKAAVETALETSCASPEAEAGSDSAGDDPLQEATASFMPQTYTISVEGCPDEETAQRLADYVKEVVAGVSQSLPLTSLDSIILAASYPQTLRALDRGFEQSRPVAPTHELYAVSVAAAPMAVGDGRLKTVIVMESALAQAMLGEDEMLVSLGLHTLVFTLVRLGHRDLLGAALLGVAENRIVDPYEALLLPISDGAPGAYFAARVSAPIKPDLADEYRQILAAALQHAAAEIPAARLVYRHDGDLDALLRAAFAHVFALLTHAARLIGHCDGLAEPAVNEGETLAEVLDQAGLRRWLELYSSDLRRLYERRGRWSSLDEFIALNRHVERLLWPHAIFPWREQGGGMQVEIPLAVDLVDGLRQIEPSILRSAWGWWRPSRSQARTLLYDFHH